MPQKSIELILFRQLATYLTIPIFMVDSEGVNLIYFNEAAEEVFGFKFSESGEMVARDLSTIFEPQDEHGERIPPEKISLYISRTQHRLAHDIFYIIDSKKKRRYIELFSFPIINPFNNYLGAVAFFHFLENEP
jgi:PAS domain S-box-containing protein